MDSLKLRVDRIVDFGTIVGLIGVDLATNSAIVVHIDHRPLNDVYDSWREAGYSEGITFNAESLTMELGIGPGAETANGPPTSA
jgi:hypothetical protein